MIETYIDIDIATLVVSFPNLLSLTIESPNADLPDLIADDLRAQNQDNLNDTEQWTTLCEFTGEVVDLYAMGLTCPIRSIDMCSVTSANLAMFQSLLDFHRPQYVCMQPSASISLAPGNNSR